MLKPFEIPLSPESQKFSITLQNIDYNMNLVWNWVSGCWVLDINDADNTPLVQAVPLVAGPNMLDQFDYIGMQGGMVAFIDTDINTAPDFTNLGKSGHLYFVAYLVEAVVGFTSTGEPIIGTVPGDDGSSNGGTDQQLPTPIHPGDPGAN